MANSGSTYITSGGEGSVPQYFGVYQAVVTRNDDPTGTGAVQATIPQLGNLQTGWAPSLTPYRSLPVVGTGVYILFAGGMVEYPVWTGQWAAPGQPASLGINVTYSATEPTSANDGDVWYQLDANGAVEGMYQYQVNAAVPSDNGWIEFNLNGSILAAGTIISNTIFASGEIEASTVTAGSISSPDYEEGVSGWSVNSDGSAEFMDISLPNFSGGGGTGSGTVVTFGVMPASANVGDIWYDTSNGLQANQCVTAYTSGGTTADWTSYQIGSGAIASGAIGTTELNGDVTARALGGTEVTVGPTEPAASSSVNGDTWIQTNSSNQVTGFWSFSGGAWVESTINITTLGGIQVTASTTAPTSPNNGDLWINESAGNVLEQYSSASSSWSTYQIGSSAIATGAVGNTQLGSGAVGTSNIQSGAVTTTQLNSSVTARALGGNKVFVSSTQPASPIVGDEWIQINSNGVAQGIFTYGATVSTPPLYVGDAELSAAATSVQVPVNDSVPYGSTLVVVMITGNTTSQTVTVADTQGNTYATSSSVAQESMSLFSFTVTNAAALTAGSDSVTITTTHSQYMAAVVFAVPNGAPISGVTTNYGASAAPSVTTYSGSAVGNVQFVMMTNNTSGTATNPTGYTSVGHYEAANATLAIDGFWQTVTTAGAQSVASTYSASANWIASAITVPYNANSWNQSIPMNASSVLAAGTITANQIAAGAIGASQIAADAINGMTITGNTIQGASIQGTDFIIEPGTNAYILGYGTPAAGTYQVTLTGSGKWTPPAGVTSAIIGVWGAGGGGGSGTTTYNHGGGGGGGGAYGVWQNVAVTAGTAYVYTCGAGGIGGSATGGAGASGGNGGSSSITIGSTTYTVAGGSGGQGGVNGNNVGGAGGAAPTANSPAYAYAGGTGGSTNHYSGAGGGSSASANGPGVNGYTCSDALYGAKSGTGGIGPTGSGNGGTGGYSPTGSTAYPVAGFAPGGGGGGGAGNTTNPQTYQSGAAGANGQIIVVFTIPSGTTPELLLSVSPTTGTDASSGTTIEDGFTTYYEKSLMQMHVNQTNSCPAIEMYSGLASEGSHPSIYTYPVNAGNTSTETENLVIAGPANTSDEHQMSIVLEANNAGGTSGAFLVFGSNTTTSISGNGNLGWFTPWAFYFNVPLGNPLYAVNPTSTSVAAEGWHTATMPSGWSTGDTGHPGVRYKKTIQNTVLLDVNLAQTTAGGVTGNATLATLPSGYIPSFQHRFGVGMLNGSSQLGGTGSLSTAGAVVVYQIPSTNTRLSFILEVPLD